jgi:predicted CoA-binding protein
MEQTPQQVLKNAQTILLVDWPGQSIPRSLLKAGKMVYGYSPGGYSKAGMAANEPVKTEGMAIFPPQKDEKGYLVFNKIDTALQRVDMVFIYRPEGEHELIFKDHVLPFGAKTIWLQPPVTSASIGDLAKKHGITIIEGIKIAKIVAKI